MLEAPLLEPSCLALALFKMLVGLALFKVLVGMCSVQRDQEQRRHSLGVKVQQ